MTKVNTWHKNQIRKENKTFAPKWNKDTVSWIISQLQEMVSVTDIQYKLVKENQISWRSADKWVAMANRVMKDMNNGLSLDQALERDRERRNVLRRNSIKKSK